MPVYILCGLLLLYIAIQISTPTPILLEDKRLLQKLDSLQQQAKLLEKQQDILLLKDSLFRANLDSVKVRLDSLKGVRSVVQNFYGSQINSAASYDAKQVDSFFKTRYNY